MFKVSYKNIRTDVNIVSLVDFEQVNFTWGAVIEIFNNCIFAFP